MLNADEDVLNSLLNELTDDMFEDMSDDILQTELIGFKSAIERKESIEKELLIVTTILQ